MKPTLAKRTAYLSVALSLESKNETITIRVISRKKAAPIMLNNKIIFFQVNA